MFAVGHVGFFRFFVFTKAVPCLFIRWWCWFTIPTSMLEVLLTQFLRLLTSAIKRKWPKTIYHSTSATELSWARLTRTLSCPDTHGRNTLGIHRWSLFGRRTHPWEMFVFHSPTFIHLCFWHGQFEAGGHIWGVFLLPSRAMLEQHEIGCVGDDIHVPAQWRFCFQASISSVCYIAGRSDGDAFFHGIKLHYIHSRLDLIYVVVI